MKTKTLKGIPMIFNYKELEELVNYLPPGEAKNKCMDELQKLKDFYTLEGLQPDES